MKKKNFIFIAGRNKVEIFDRHENMPWLKENTIFLSIVGSQLYGTNLDKSDTDYKGIVIPPKEYYFGFHKKFEQAETKDPDSSLYDIRKFFKLAADNNPNLLELLWYPEEFHLFDSTHMQKIRAHKEKFLSRNAYYRFSGYAISQLKRIRLDKDNIEDKTTKRVDLIKKFGYDTKHAMHLVRLLRMCEEILRYGDFDVHRKDKDELISIRNGSWTYEEVLKFAEEKDKELKSLMEISKLPKNCDIAYLDKLCVSILLDFYKERKEI